MSESIQAIEFFITLGGIFLLGLATDFIGRNTIMPRVTLLLIFGIVIGEHGLDLIPDIFTNNFYLITNIALLMIGFVLGSKLTYKLLSTASRQIFWISVSGALVTAIIVTAGLYLVGVAFEIAILAGCISSATAPAATTDVVIESNFKGPFSNLLLSIVAIDDAWALILFSLGLALHSVILGLESQSSPLLHAFQDIGGAILLGLVIGAPASYLSGRIRPGQPILTEALGLVFTCGGIALYLNVSPIIAAMTMGAVIVNFGKHHEYTFHEIEHIEWPFMLVFFLLAGASLEISTLKDIGIIGVAYIVCRIIGKAVGGWIGAYISQSDKKTRKWIGVALLPQAGVAIGMALVVTNQYPQYRQILLPLVISASVFFEVIGPMLTRYALKKAETGAE